jgi:hypothetical protein
MNISEYPEDGGQPFQKKKNLDERPLGGKKVEMSEFPDENEPRKEPKFKKKVLKKDDEEE